MRKFHHSLRRFFALVVGLVFFVSGFLKLKDPVGTGLKMAEYFKFLHCDFLLPVAKGSGVAFSLLEVLLGSALIAGIARKVAAIAVLILITDGHATLPLENGTNAVDDAMTEAEHRGKRNIPIAVIDT